MTAWPFPPKTDLQPSAFLADIGAIFARFDARTQDSGNVSFGVESEGRRWFVKTAGDPADPTPFLPHAERVALLENAARLARSFDHAALPTLHGVVGCAWGPMLVYDWVPGELIGTPAARRQEPECPLQRFRAMPPTAIAAAIDTILDAHVGLAAEGWVACDFYDGSMIYEFASGRLSLIDLDSYHRGPLVNEMGRMFGSTRFMAPEEFERGAIIDERTTVFTLGRTAAVFLSDGTLARAPFRGTDTQYAAMTQSCRPEPAERFATVAALAAAWRG